MVSNFDLNRTVLNNQMMGLSTDTKPTTGILPNSLFWELDTNGMYYFDGTQWQSIGGSGGGGGGGSSDFSTAEVTIVNHPMSINLPVIVVDSEANLECIMCPYIPTEDETFTIALYKGHCYYDADDSAINDISGSIQYDDDLAMFDITGNCTITFIGAH